MFDEDPEFRGVRVDELILKVGDGSRSVIQRGRALLEIGRRADGRPDLQERLFGWLGDDSLRAKRWVGPVTLAWIAACGLGHSLKGQEDRERLSEMLRAWPDADRDLLLKWAEGEGWFDGIA
ncbi:hypothetical protein [Actinoplanes sp. NPDC049802]|uniref:hypothetical protein n=1 Tax=Actinoplanes sp. NPDC049802 TaxID=3154742 RepID=UPI0033DD9F6D